MGLLGSFVAISILANELRKTEVTAVSATQVKENPIKLDDNNTKLSGIKQHPCCLQQ